MDAARARNGRTARVLVVLVLALSISGCSLFGSSGAGIDGGSGDELLSAEAEPLQVVATTTIVGDVAHELVGERAEVIVLIPPGADPHSFQPTPQDMAAVARADVVFVNGLGLEVFMDELLRNARAEKKVVEVSRGIEVLEFAGGHDHEGGSTAENPEERVPDPHVWFDPNNIMVWTQNIEHTLVELDPDNAADYSDNAGAYREKLEKLDRWIREQVAQVPQEQRCLVTDHHVLGYFADRYGFEQLGAVVPGLSTLAEPGARQLGELHELIRSRGVKAIFVGVTSRTELAESVARDTGAELIRIYTGSLSRGEPAATYLDFLRYNVSAIVGGLK